MFALFKLLVKGSQDVGANINLVDIISYVSARVAESEVKYPTATPIFPKFPTPTPDSDSGLSKISDSDSRLLNVK